MMQRTITISIQTKNPNKLNENNNKKSTNTMNQTGILRLNGPGFYQCKVHQFLNMYKKQKKRKEIQKKERIKPKKVRMHVYQLGNMTAKRAIKVINQFKNVRINK